MSNDPVVNQVAQLNDIVEIISGYFPLKKAGRNFKACCPFHQEKTPSFMVSPDRQSFHCFGCSVGGDVYTFVMKMENMTFPEALNKLADRVHVTLPRLGGGRGGEKGESRKEKLYEICQLAAQFYVRNFQDAKVGALPRTYLQQRGFDAQVIESYRVGYATDGWQNLYDFLRQKGFTDDLLFRSGLVTRSEKGRPFDLFRKRVIFPIVNSQGKVVAFGGRVLDKEGTPKYLNSPESEIFQKRSELYGLFQAKKHINQDQSRLLMVEGYLDLIRLVQSGFPNSVATLGTSLTQEHCRLLRRYVMETVLVYDGDRAGESASLRGIDIFLEEGMNVKLLSLPSSLDPDDFLRQRGPEAFRRLLENALDVFEFKLTHLLKRFNPRESVGLVKITNEFLEMLLKVKNSVLTDRYLKRASGVLGIDERSLRTEFLKLQSKQAGQEKTGGDKKSTDASWQTPAYVSHEWTLLSLVPGREDLLKVLIRELQGDDFRDPEARKIFEFLCEYESRNEPRKLTLSSLVSRIQSDEIKSFLARLSFFELTEEENRKAFQDCMDKIRSENWEERLNQLVQKIKQAEASGEDEKVLEYVKQYQALVAKKRSGSAQQKIPR